MRNIVKNWFLRIWCYWVYKIVKSRYFRIIVKSLNIGFIKFDYFINRSGEILKEFKDVLKNNINWFILRDL